MPPPNENGPASGDQPLYQAISSPNQTHGKKRLS